MLENAQSCAVLHISATPDSIITVSYNGVIVYELNNDLGWYEITDNNVIHYLCNITQLGEYTITNITNNKYSDIITKKIVIDDVKHYEISIFSPLYLLNIGDIYTDNWTKLASYNITIDNTGFYLSRNGTQTYMGFYTTNPLDLTKYNKLNMTFTDSSNAQNGLFYGPQIDGYTGSVLCGTTNGTIYIDISSVTGLQYVKVANAGSASLRIKTIWLED